jgi:hypothetical protein
MYISKPSDDIEISSLGYLLYYAAMPWIINWPILLLLYVYISSTKSLLKKSFFPSQFPFFKNLFSHKNEAYTGPAGDMSSMEIVIPHKYLDIDLMVGPSTLSPNAGKGLFISVNNNNNICEIKQGSTNYQVQ